MDVYKATTRDSVLGYVIRQARERAGLKQDDLAAKIGLPASSLSRIENGSYAVSANNFMAIANALGTTGSELAAQVERCEHQIKAMGGQVALRKEEADNSGAVLVGAAVLLGALFLLGRK